MQGLGRHRSGDSRAENNDRSYRMVSYGMDQLACSPPPTPKNEEKGAPLPRVRRDARSKQQRYLGSVSVRGIDLGFQPVAHDGLVNLRLLS